MADDKTPPERLDDPLAVLLDVEDVPVLLIEEEEADGSLGVTCSRFDVEPWASFPWDRASNNGIPISRPEFDALVKRARADLHTGS